MQAFPPSAAGRIRPASALALLAAAVVIAWAAGRVLSQAPLYLSASARDEFGRALSALRSDTGWGLTNYRIERYRCDDDACRLTLTFRYLGRPEVVPPAEALELSWKRGIPEGYERR